MTTPVAVPFPREPSRPTPKSYAQDFFGKLKEDGCGTRDIVNVSAQLLALVTASLRESE